LKAISSLRDLHGGVQNPTPVDRLKSTRKLAKMNDLSTI